MRTERIMELLKEVGAAITNDHIVYTSGRHGTAYINKDAIYPHTEETSLLCRAIAEHFQNYEVDCVLAPAIGGIPLSQWTAHHLSMETGKEVLSAYVEHEETTIFISEGEEPVHITLPSNTYTEGNETGEIVLKKGDKLVVKKPTFVAKRGYDKLIAGRKTLVVEDILTTGGSAKRTIEAARSLGCDVVGLGVLCNRGNVTPQMVANPPELFALVNVTLDMWDASKCQLCAHKVPVQTGVGKGNDFLASPAGKAIYG